MTEVDCEYCGDSFKEQGLATHQRFCDDAEEGGSQDDVGHSDLEETEAEPRNLDTSELADLEESVLERDNDACARCGETEELVVHAINQEKSDEKAHLVVLCGRCDAEIDGLHPRTKRTKIQNH